MSEESFYTFKCIIYLQTKSIRSGLLINDITDHLPIFPRCNYEIGNNKNDPGKYVRKNENVSLLRNSLSQEIWNIVLQSEDVNVAYINFI